MTTNNNDSNHSRGSNTNNHNSRGSNQCHNSHDDRDHQQNGRGGGAAGINNPRIEEWNRNLSAVIHLAEMELQSLGKSAATTVTYFLLYSCLLNK